MRKGCLSGIKPGRGTNRNESLHKDLNNIMSSGVELAYGLFTVSFYKHNEKMASNAEKRIAYPYQVQNNYCTISEKIGLSFESSSDAISSSITSVEIPDLDINSCTYTEIYSRLAGIPLHLKRMPPVFFRWS